MRDLEPWPAPAALPAPAVTRTKARAGASEEGCDLAALRHSPWRLSPEACVRAFEAKPKNASLALATAHAHHGRGRLAEAAEWAKRAVALDPKLAEAYIIIGRDELANGRREGARAAYGRYLEIAPRGWHQAEARAAVR
jgi:tetratricopeptide (TPR) repeat protein